MQQEHMSNEANQPASANATKPAKPPRRSRESRREESQARILDASLKLLVERGYDAFSLQDVGRMAACSHELVNHYFTNKDGLLNALAEHIVTGRTDLTTWRSKSAISQR
jgi:AcrR family transcriptional regulator